MFTLAHLSDPHLAGWSLDHPVALFSKRITGYLSWRLRRVKIHLPQILDSLVADMKAEQPDHVAVTGDLTNISLPQEFAAAADWLKSLGAPEDVTVIPGNHDAYVPLPFDQSIGLWRANMTGLMPGQSSQLGAAEQPVGSLDDFPYVRQRGAVALIGTSTAVPTRPFSAAGLLGETQLARLETVLRQLGAAGLFRVLLIHHPPYVSHGGGRKSLRDHAALREILKKTGVELVLHGHTHISGLGKIETPGGSAPVIGVPSASAVKYGHKDFAAYHLYRIDRTAAGWQLGVSVRTWNPDIARFTETGEMALTI